MATDVNTLPADDVLIAAALRRISTDLEMMLGHELTFEEPRSERSDSRPAGLGQVHVSFKLGLSASSAQWRHAALLVPLPDAIAMACFLLMIPEGEVAGRREEPAPDGPLKDAMMEIGNMFAGALGAALGEVRLSGWTVRSEGCQGVRAGVRPALDYQEGSELLVTRVQARIGSFETFELLLLLPPLG